MIKSFFLVIIALVFFGCSEDDKSSIDPSNPITLNALFEVENIDLSPGKVYFKNLSTGAESYSWDFGDFNTSTITNPSHTYTEIGTYEVVLTAKHLQNESTHSITVEITEVEEIKVESWSFVNDFPGDERFLGLSFVVNGKYYAGLGADWIEPSFRDLWEYDPQNGSWIQKGEVPFTLNGGVSLVIDGQVYVGLGKSNYSPNKRFWKYNPNDDTWSQLNDFYEYAGHNTTMGAAAFSFDGKGYVFNGSEDTSSELWTYDPNYDQWEKLSNLPFVARSFSGQFIINNKIYIVSGHSPNNTNDINEVWEYDPENNLWTQKNDFPGESRIGAASFALNGVGYFGLGWKNYIYNFDNGYAEYYSDFYKYYPETDLWYVTKRFPDDNRVFPFVMQFEDRAWVCTGKNHRSYNEKGIWEFKVE